MKSIRLPSGEQVSALGQGTLRMARSNSSHADCVAALRVGLDLGMTLIDTAEAYGGGEVEELVGTAIAGRRDQVFLVSKVYPPDAYLVELCLSARSWMPASLRSLVPASAKALVRRALEARRSSGATDSLSRTRRDIVAACERSLRRLRTDRLDLYLLHRRGTTPLAEAIEAFRDLIQAGKLRYFGVSNFGVADLEEWWTLGGAAAATNQVLYNLDNRAIERDLLPWCQRHGVPIMAYSPLDQGRILAHPALGRIASRHGVSPAPIALAWLLRQDGLIVIPEATRPDHLRANIAALDIRLTPEDFAELDVALPRRKRLAT